jgi:quinol monooxygenase YgiN
MIASATSMFGAFALALASPLPASAATKGAAAHKAGVTVVAKVVAKAGQEQALHDLFLGLVGPARSEATNVSYDLYTSIDDPATFVSVECWTSADALAAHLKTPIVVDTIGKLGPVVAAPPSIVSFKMVSDPV